MNVEIAAAIIAGCGVGGTAFNLWIALNIRNSVLGMKLWATDKFVAKEDMTHYLSPIKESIQMVGSIRRMKGHDPNHIPPDMRTDP